MLEYIDGLTQLLWVDGVPYVNFVAVPLCMMVGTWIPSAARFVIEVMRTFRTTYRLLTK